MLFQFEPFQDMNDLGVSSQLLYNKPHYNEIIPQFYFHPDTFILKKRQTVVGVSNVFRNGLSSPYGPHIEMLLTA